MSNGGKGSAARPMEVAHTEYSVNFSRVFGLSRLERLKLAEQTAISSLPQELVSGELTDSKATLS